MMIRAEMYRMLLVMAMSATMAACGDDNEPPPASPDAGEPVDARPDVDAMPPGDTEPPVATFVIPDNMVWHSRQFEIVGTLSDNVAVTELSVAVDGGTPMPVTIEPGAEIEIAFVVQLEPGPNQIHLTVMDTAGNSTERDATIVFGARVAAAGAHSLAIAPGAAGTLLGWGRNNQEQLGLTGTDPFPDASAIPGISDIVAIAANLNHSVGLDSQGTVWTWGRNNEGQLGRPSGPDDGVPTAVSGLTDIVAIAAGQRHTLVLTRDGSVWAWGSNTSGQLGVETPDTRAEPEQVPGLTTEIIAIAAGGSFSLALDIDGAIWAWGNNGDGQLAVTAGGTRSTPARIVGASDIVAIAAGRSHGLATAADGRLFSWGLNASGQLATGDEDDRDAFTEVDPLSMPVATVRSAGNFSAALLYSGRLIGWGQNFNGQLGNGENGTEADTVEPVPVDIADVIDVSAGLAHSVALTADGRVYAWGLNSFGQLGNGMTGIDSSANTPTEVTLP